MAAFLILAAVGAAVVILGIRIREGYIDAVHWYHRQRVTEENKAAFGKQMGLGTMFCGAGIILFGVLAILAELTAKSVFMTAGVYLTIVCLAVGIGIMISTTMKYNNGIFS